MASKYCIILGEKFEDIEALSQIDLLRRAGVMLDIFGVNNLQIKSRSNVVYTTEKLFKTASDINTADYAGILIPGGPGAHELSKNAELIKTVQAFNKENKLIFAICAAPLVLDRAGLLNGRKFTCFPGEIANIPNGMHLDERVVIDGNIITSQGVGTSLDAAVKLVEIIVSKEEADSQKKKVVYHD